MLIITNGDCAADKIGQLDIEANILPWRDVLHDGPVPANIPLEDLSSIRARYIVDRGWGDFDQIRKDFAERDNILLESYDENEVVLWFEHDLYDQLQMIQILAFFATSSKGPHRLTLICRDEFIAESSSARLQELFDSRAEVTEEQLAAANAAWTAYREPEPTELHRISLVTPSTELPFLSQSLQRHFEEFPNISNGLSRNESQIISNVAAGITTPAKLFQATQRLENPQYLGDASFWLYIKGLSEGKMPLLETSTGKPFLRPSMQRPDQEFKQQTLTLTRAGHQVLDNTLDWIEINGIDKWLGGVHIHYGNIWRWDPSTNSFSKSNT